MASGKGAALGRNGLERNRGKELELGKKSQANNEADNNRKNKYKIRLNKID